MEAAIEPKYEIQHLVYQKPCSPCLLKTTAQQQVAGQLDFDEASPLHWNLNAAILSFEKKKRTP